MSKLVAAVGNRSVPTQEMRKQAANLVGKIVVTGQESVQGSRRPMREDIYKKHISADKVPERLPFAIHTALVELRGWKRFELNSVPKLLGRRSIAVVIDFSCRYVAWKPHHYDIWSRSGSLG